MAHQSVVLYSVIDLLVIGWTDPLQDSLMSIGGDNKNLESWSAVGIVCGTSTRNALPSTEYTVSCDMAAVLHGDCNLIGGRF